MTARKSERLLNLLIALLVSRTYVGKERLREVVEQYRDQSDEAFEKMFERDKEELRSLGVPLEVGYPDPLFEDEPGYRVDRSSFELPELHLEPDEAAVVGLAARVWQHAGLAAATSDALLKLKAAGVLVDRAVLDVLEPHLAADEPAFEAFWDATLSRTTVRFDYRRADSPEVTTRTVQPWGVTSYRGRWYAVGHDVDRGSERVFRLSRVQGPVRRIGRAGAYEVPEDADIRALTRAFTPAEPDREARLLVREGRGQGLRGRATTAENVPELPGWQRLRVPFADAGTLAEEVLGHGADVVLEEPEDVRELVVSRLRVLTADGTDGEA